ncbi:hypothetical protein [Bifidobacterium tibiigranuli]|jgi:hypothetical protein|uniref:hypothetical protein n=1 Tax=Bifidobacterium tibiigranuli TaxID=2172043 RepID=UPI002355BC73|nr:hypothetical protein [Bifidobacterium tibiigranuli]MCI1211110.1 hypothetical protein [Bifidobacterium tibiigranuli]MCI1220380.1 hypothetical protein [Bifidobacterium tibiigranuli]MCI1231938.1 hypothetical protein [Bifidobacterium tibiigranuli]MCI1255028.1 hypothetical protein [Bifidobacterium tibiigranuli]
MRNLNNAAYAPTSRVKPISQATSEAEKDGSEWVKTSVNMRADTRRRLKVWAAEHDQRLQEALDDAINAWLD